MPYHIWYAIWFIVCLYIHSSLQATYIDAQPTKLIQHICICPFIYPSMSVYLHAQPAELRQHMCLSIYLSIHLSISLFNHLSIHPNLPSYTTIWTQTAHVLCLSIYLSITLFNPLSIHPCLSTFMHNQQNSDPHTAQVIWLQDPSSILTMRTLHLGHTFTSRPPPFTPLSSLPDLNRKTDIYINSSILFNLGCAL